MLQIVNFTPFAAERAVLLDKDGHQVWTVVVKGTFRLDADGTPRLDDEQEPVCRAPRYSDGPDSSLLRECELVPDHPGTDVTLNATAYAPSGQPVQQLEVALAIGPVQTRLRVIGNREWERGPLTARMTAAKPFAAMPITYERAFGGCGGDCCEERNPVGTGLARRTRDAVGMALPNIEDPNDLITRPGSRPRPVGLGAIASRWSPRREYAGTFDAEWERRRKPLWPEDHDPRFYQSAHPDLVSERPLRGGEPVELINLTPDSWLSFDLPRVYLTLVTTIGTRRIRRPAQLDRVIVEPDARKLVLVWRSSLDCGANAANVEKTVIDLKPYVDA